MYWSATRFLWRVFTHPKNPPEHLRDRASAAADGSARAPSFRARARRTELAKEQARA
jgi:hypothetical protein